MENTLVKAPEEGFIEKFGLWSEEQKMAAEKIIADIEELDFLIVRIGWVDQHGVLKSKRVPKEGFIKTLKNGLNTSTGTFIFDTSSVVIFNPFIPGGGHDVPEMEGCPNVTLVPDPLTFKFIPYAERTAMVICDIYFNNGQPFPFSSRYIYSKALKELEARGLENVVGLEVEWYLTKLEDQMLDVQYNGTPGVPPVAPKVKSVTHGYWYQGEPYDQGLHDFMEVLAENLMKMGLPLRTMENEMGPGQLEFVFDPLKGMEAADAFIYFKMVTKQLAFKYGYMASFMCRPALNGFYSSGWHLHQSIVQKETGENLFVSQDEPISEFGKYYLGGILQNAPAASVFTTPTINGYKRYKPNSLAPTRTVWGVFNRGAMVNVHGIAGDEASHIENRVGEPGANAYLYMASQVISGLHGVDNQINPGKPSDTPYDNEQPQIPTSLEEALSLLKENEVFQQALGSSYINYISAIKENEVARYKQFLIDHELSGQDFEPTEWEQREYFELL